MVMSPQQIMLLFILFLENHLHATLRGECSPLPHPLRLLPLIDFFYLPHCFLIDVAFTLVYANPDLSNQSCHSTLPPPSTRDPNCSHRAAIITSHVGVVFDGRGRLFSFQNCTSCPVTVYAGSLGSWSPVCLIWVLVLLEVITGAVFHFRMN